MSRVNRSGIPPALLAQYRDQRNMQLMNESLNNAQARRMDIQQTGGISPSSFAMMRAQQANQLGVRSTGLESAQAGILGQQNAAMSMREGYDRGQAAQGMAQARMTEADANAFNTRTLTPAQVAQLQAQAAQQQALANEQETETRGNPAWMRGVGNFLGNAMLGGQVQRQQLGNQMIQRGGAAPSDVQVFQPPQQPSETDRAEAALKNAQAQQVLAEIAAMLPPDQKLALDNARAIVAAGKYGSDEATYAKAVQHLAGYLNNAGGGSGGGQQQTSSGVSWTIEQ